MAWRPIGSKQAWSRQVVATDPALLPTTRHVADMNQSGYFADRHVHMHFHLCDDTKDSMLPTRKCQRNQGAFMHK